MSTKTDTHSADYSITLEASIGFAVDREASLIRGVKLIGFESLNGRDYPPEVLRADASKYEGVKVNIDHPDQPTRSRSMRDRFGTLHGARFVEGQGVFADLKFNPKHHLSEQVLWAAENDPKSIGLSHNATLKLGPKVNGRDRVESIVSVRHVDVVADPATTKGLFESQQPENEMKWEDITLEELKANRADLVTSIEATEAAKHADTARKLALAERQVAVEAEIKASGLPEKSVTTFFRAQLLATESADARKLAIEDRKAIVAIESKAEQKTAEKPVTESAPEIKPIDAASIRSMFR